MATIKVYHSATGKPLSNVKVEVKSTFGFQQYYQVGRTDGSGEVSFEDNANRFYILVNEHRVDRVDRLKGTIEVRYHP